MENDDDMTRASGEGCGAPGKDGGKAGEESATFAATGSDGVSGEDTPTPDALPAGAVFDDGAFGAAMAAAAAEDAAAGDAPTAEEAFLASMLSGRDLTGLTDAEGNPLVAPEEDDGLTDEERAARDERRALRAAIEAVRSRAADGRLTTPSDWAEAGLVPDTMEEVDFCDWVFDAVIAAQERSKERAALALEVPDAEDVDPQDMPAIADALPGIPAEADEDPDADPSSWDLDDIRVLEGSQTYLYSDAHMTDAFAHWAFLAAEGDDVMTLVDNARSESKTYPRPMIASSLKNRPYCMDDDRIEAAFRAARESGEYPDIETCAASNGDVYYYSTEYLSPAQAKALAQWYSVERAMNV